MPAFESALGRLGRIEQVPRPSDEAVVDAFGTNLHLDPQQMRRLVTCELEELEDVDLYGLGSTREEAVDLAREIKRGLGPAYRRVFGVPPRRSSAVVVPLASRRLGTRARGAGRPAARRTGGTSSSSGSGDDGSGPADPEPSSRPARRWALYRQSQPMGGRQRAVILALGGHAIGRAG